MINLYDTHGRALGNISETQLQFLIDSMEEDSIDDQDYYLEAATLDYLEARGADMELMTFLHSVLGDRSGITLRWSRE
ncbi:MAG: hypothetical protein KA170_01810 [Candidatus Promineofilum sp.]|nr:hypothetical protein [Promineifilum sp.]